MKKKYNYLSITLAIVLVNTIVIPVKAIENMIDSSVEVENIVHENENLETNPNYEILTENNINISPSSSDIKIEQNQDFNIENFEYFQMEEIEIITHKQDEENTEVIENEDETIVDNEDSEIIEEEKNTEIIENEDEIIINNEDSENSEIESLSEIENEDEENQLSPEELARIEKMQEADELYLSGNINEAEAIYRSLKEPFAIEEENPDFQRLEAYSDPELLPPAGGVYWRISGEGIEQDLESKIFVPLEFLVTQFPEFIPGHLRYAEALQEYERLDEAVKVLDQAVILYPNEPDLIYAKIEVDNEAEKWLEASLVARRFSLFNPDHPLAEEFLLLAEENLEKYQDHLRSEITGNAIANFFTGALGFLLTGNIFGPLSALETTMLLLQGETGVGEEISAQVKDQLPLLEDEEVNTYINEIGQKLAQVAGRDDFEYEFSVIMDDNLNAFALPGGKIFVNIGAIMETESEAELAGLLAHEIAHAVLSHGFQLVTEGNLTANLFGNIPYVGGIATNLIVLNYSRTMEEEADIFGTRMLAASGYAADGVRNLMAILASDERPSPPAWLSTHPDTNERVNYLETFIIENGFNRYAYEGITRHQYIQEKVNQRWEEYLESDEYKERELNNRRRRRR